MSPDIARLLVPEHKKATSSSVPGPQASDVTTVCRHKDQVLVYQHLRDHGQEEACSMHVTIMPRTDDWLPLLMRVRTSEIKWATGPSAKCAADHDPHASGEKLVLSEDCDVFRRVKERMWPGSLLFAHLDLLDPVALPAMVPSTALRNAKDSDACSRCLEDVQLDAQWQFIAGDAGSDVSFSSRLCPNDFDGLLKRGSILWVSKAPVPWPHKRQRPPIRQK